MASTMKLPVGIDDFRKLRESHFYYVDKTRLIEQLLLNWSEVTLFTRPRRFGKTLNMSMLKSFFDIGTDKALFDGLYISGNKELCDEYMGKYPVIFLSLKGVEGLTYEEAFEAFVRIMGKEVNRVSFLADSDKLTQIEREQYKGLTIMKNGRLAFDKEKLISSLQLLSQLLYKHYGKKVVILIDEYDVPLDKAFQNGYYECQTESKENAYVAKAERAEGKKWLTDFTEQGNCGKQGRNNNYSKTGYLNKKGVHPGVAASKSQKEPSKDYPWPVIRLAELYLSYAEACIAYNKDGYLEKGMVKLDRIRERAGLLSVKDSWKNAKNPIVSYEGNGGLNGKLTEIVRQERMIELYLEQQNFWDIRRWKLGDKYFNVPVKGMNIDATDINGFATVKTLPDVRNFDTPRQYLLPIPAAEVSKNPNMVQNPNY